MKKESKNLGVRRACINVKVCKNYAVTKDINLTGKGYYKSKCDMCFTWNKIIINAETHVTVEPEFSGLRIAGQPMIGILKNPTPVRG